jgi:hypothetical protein
MMMVVADQQGFGHFAPTVLHRVAHRGVGIPSDDHNGGSTGSLSQLLYRYRTVVRQGSLLTDER